MMRLSRARRRLALLAAGVYCAERGHYLTVTRKHVAARAGVAPTLITHMFGSMDAFRAELMRAAIAWGHNRVIAQGLTARDPAAIAAPRLKRWEALLEVYHEQD